MDESPAVTSGESISTSPSTTTTRPLSLSISDDLISSLQRTLTGIDPSPDGSASQSSVEGAIDELHRSYIKESVAEGSTNRFSLWDAALRPHYRVETQLGAGAYGIVASAECLSRAAGEQPGAKVAIKRLATQKVNLLGAKRALREIAMLHRISHVNCISILDLHRGPDRAVFIVTQLMDTDLGQVIDSDQALSSEHVSWFLYNILRGILYLHSAGVVHRDLKPANIFVNENCDVRLGDLGMARLLVEGDKDERPGNLTEYVVTRWWRAPEVMVAQSYGFAIDVWSVGTIFAELVQRKPLFRGKDYADQIRKIISILGTPLDSEIQSICDPGARDFIRSLPYSRPVAWQTMFPAMTPSEIALLDGMLAFNPNSRLTVSQALASPVFSQIRDPAAEIVAEHPFRLDFVDESLESLEDVDRFLDLELKQAAKQRADRCFN